MTSSKVVAWDTTLGELTAFVVLHQTGSFTRAAQLLHISQPGLSARIFRLERAVGHRLVDRSMRPAGLTHAGRRFLPYAEALVRAMAEGRAAVDEEIAVLGPPARPRRMRSA